MYSYLHDVLSAVLLCRMSAIQIPQAVLDGITNVGDLLRLSGMDGDAADATTVAGAFCKFIGAKAGTVALALAALSEKDFNGQVAE